jgi:CheY-like chemotaxis protein
MHAKIRIWTVAAAENGRRMMHRLANRVGLIEAKLMMPEMDSFEFVEDLWCRRVTARKPIA